MTPAAEERLERFSVITLGAYFLAQPLAPGPAQAVAFTLIGLFLARLCVAFARRRDPRATAVPALFGPAAWLTLGLLATVVLATFLSPSPKLAAPFARKYWHLALLPAAASLPAPLVLRHRKRLAVAGAISLSLAALAGILDFFLRWNFKWDVLTPRPERDRAMLYGFFDHHMTYAGFLCVVAFALGGVALTHTDPKVRRWTAVPALLVAALLVAARKRAYWLGGGVAMLLLLSRVRRRLLAGAAVAVIAIFAAGYLVPGDFRRRIERVFDERDNEQRVGFWRVGAAMVQDRPLQGWGPGGYRLYGQPYLEKVFRELNAGYRDNFTHVHNVYLQVALEGGVPLSAAFASLLAYLLSVSGRDWWRRGGSTAAALGAGVFAMLVALLVAGFFEWNLMDKEVGMPAFVVSGLYLALRSGERSVPPSTPAR